MRHYILFFLLATSTILVAQETKTANWFTQQQEATKHAQENNTAILMVFAGSDWCRPCIQFKENILGNDVFAQYANKNLTILYLDFPLKKKNKGTAETVKHNEKLADQYNKSGAFPKILLLNTAGEVLTDIHYKNQTAETFIQNCREILDK